MKLYFLASLLSALMLTTLTLMSCRSSQLQPRLSPRVSPLSLKDFLLCPFSHEPKLAVFQKELANQHPTRMLFQLSPLSQTKDTIYKFRLPKKSEILLLRTAKEIEVFMAANIATPRYALRNNIRVGLSSDSLCYILPELPTPLSDTIRLESEKLPYQVRFFLKEGKIVRFQVFANTSKDKR